MEVRWEVPMLRRRFNKHYPSGLVAFTNVQVLLTRKVGLSVR